VPESVAASTKHLQNLWDEKEAHKYGGDPLEAVLRYSVESARKRSAHHQFRRRQHQLEIPAPRSADRRSDSHLAGQGQRRRPALDHGRRASRSCNLDKLEQLIARYRGEASKTRWLRFYPVSAFGENRVAASIDTPLHAFLPFEHVDHLHPDWAIALAASANGEAKLDEFNATYGRRIVWVPWQRPGFELALMLPSRGRGACGLRRHSARQPRPV